MSLVTTNYETSETLNSDYSFYRLFYSTNVVSAKNLVLPATSLTYYCYREMFASCTLLEEGPSVLPCKNLNNSAVGCYIRMFYQCTSLTKAPEIAATGITADVFREMFHSCKSLKVAPELMSETLVSNCYQRMFFNCTSLNTVRCRSTNVGSTTTTSSWLHGVSPTGTFYCNPSATGWPRNATGVPSGWTIEIGQ